MSEQGEIQIRAACQEDAEKLLEIYRPYVEKTAISFEDTVPAAKEFAGRIARVLTRYPYLVALRRGEPVGYAYAGPFVGRAAYDRAAEVTIYVKEEERKTGVGRRLYERLEAVLKKQNLTNLYACIGVPPEEEDEYLTRNSVQFHAHMGYRLVGEFRKCGYKFGRWYNMVWMERIIKEHKENPDPVIPFSKEML